MSTAIQTALANFQTLALKDAARQFLAKLGYKSDKVLVGAGSQPQDFLTDFASGHAFDPAKALVPEWKTADLLFQLTDQELSRESSLFTDDSVQRGLLKSYIFIAIELKGTEYARGKFSGIARQINRLFPMPVMVVFKHGDRLTIAVINRRRNKIDDSKDVLEKATLIRDIAFVQPHRGHLDILASLALPALVHPQKKPITDFDTLHAAWEQIFNVELLNERFYRELANWYFWALPQVEFPADLEPDKEKRNATGLIRLLTRLIFCWFLKEKNLIPEKLFHPTDLAKILKGFDPESETSSTYYQAILQNLFFATLNQRMGKDSNGKPYRIFAKDEGFQKNRATYDVNNLYRYEALFREEPDAALAHFADIPFLNGGLFECLDRTEDGTDKKRYLDGFSRNAKKRPHVPDRLFFDSGETADLSTAYGDTKRKAERVTGLITILNRYKFTIVENTPIDQEIALDPELLGKVFENLLASYNEETKTTARKQTGSFYTPRPIVDYMVDESLKAHLTRSLVEKARMKEPDARAGLDLLFAYTEKEHPFTNSPVAVATLIAAIDALKILDPACGSGAFPMGVLHKLVYILQKLDPDNDRWKQTQLAKLDSAPMREELERAFADNNDDYGRKLYLIENCLYGVDIQPIAIQITKLRFFISLVCDQKTNRNKKDNHGIRPLPNLETKFVAADTLIGLPEMTQSLLVDPRVGLIEKEIESLYHSHFSEQRRDRKLANQRKVKSLRQELGRLLAESLMAPKKAQHIAEWDAFDPQSTADFFDPHWMFGQTLADGFDIVIANPPYLFLSGKGSLVQKLAKEGKQQQADRLKAYFDLVAERLPRSSEGCRDYYKWFIDRGLSLLAPNGVLAYITPNTFLTLNRYADVRKLLFGDARSNSNIIDLGFDVFEVPIVPSAITVTQRKVSKGAKSAIQFADLKQAEGTFKSTEAIQSAVLDAAIEVAYKEPQLLLFKHPLAESIYLNSSKSGIHYFKAKEGEHGLDMSRLLTAETSSRNVVPVVIDSELSRFVFCRQGSVPIDACPRFDSDLHSGRRMFIRKTGDSIVCGFPDGEHTAVAHQNVYVVKAHDPRLHWAVSAILNSSVATFLYRCGIHGQKGRIMAQFRVHALEAIPFPAEILPIQATLFDRIVPLIRVATPGMRAFLEDLIDACVMESYFREHMAERDLLFHDTVAPHLAAYAPEASATQQRDFLTHLHQTLNAPSHPIRNRLLRLTADSPDLLAIIKAEGTV